MSAACLPQERQNRFERDLSQKSPISPKSPHTLAVREHAILAVTVIKGRALNDTQVVLSQDPYVRATWVGTNATASTDYVSGGGTEPTWEGGDGSVLRLDIKKRHDLELGTASLQRQSADGVKNALLLEIVNHNFFFDDLVAFAVLVFAEDHSSVWLHNPAGGTPTKREPASIGAGPITIDLSMPVEGDVERRRSSGGKLIVCLRFENANAVNVNA